MIAKKTKVAVLGGGAGALSAAFALSATEDLRSRFDVTVHQAGFRLGGKAATGRNKKEHDVILDGAGQMFLGAYDSAFRLVRECYQALEKPHNAPIQKWQDAFVRHNHAVVFCQLSGESAYDGGWFPWVLRFPENSAEPGDGAACADKWVMFRLAVEWLWNVWNAADEVSTLGIVVKDANRSVTGDLPAWVQARLAEMESKEGFGPIDHPLIGKAIAENNKPSGINELGLGRLVAAVRNVVRFLPDSPNDHPAWAHHVLAALIRKLMDRAWELLHGYVAVDPWAYKIWVSINLAGSIALGMLTDGLLFHESSAVDHLDFRQWLERHGANNVTLESGLVQAIYNAVFAYVNGDPEKGNLAAGTCLGALLWAFCTYKGSVFWQLAAGAGDTVFAPLYAVLKKRGVKFRFFHKVAALSLSPDKKAISAIELVEQVKLHKGSYDPLIMVNNLPCWPNEPLYDQIVDGDELALSGVDLESPYSPAWKDAKRTTLISGLDFDEVVLGISIGAIPYIAPELVLENAAFRGMIANVGTVQTLSFQLWLNKTLPEVGFSLGSQNSVGPVTTSYVMPMEGWSDLSSHLKYESWGGEGAPQTLVHFHGPLEQLGPTSPFSDVGFPAKQKARVISLARKYLENDVGRIWPLAAKSEGHGFRWDFVVTQHHSANVDPSDRVVLSSAGSLRHRLAPGESGFTNLVLAGDWVKTTLNVGCIEAAVEAGFEAAGVLTRRSTQTESPESHLGS
ncbi:MAG: NAD(P)-binding protein [Polyangiaceae bacterium]|nr:NAD(P)-binding protein [Polyangiaceae bacterium]